MYVKGVLVTLVAALAASLPAGAGSRYDDGPCRAGRVGWANDACAARQWGFERIGVARAWRVTRGGGVRVAVVDTGADFRHPDLRRPTAGCVRPRTTSAYPAPIRSTALAG